MPRQRVYIHEHGSGGVGDVGDVDGAAGEAVHEPRVHGAESNVAVRGGGGDGGDVIEEPSHLHAGEVRADGEAADAAKVVLVAELALEVLAQPRGARVQPHDGVVQGAPVEARHATVVSR